MQDNYIMEDNIHPATYLNMKTGEIYIEEKDIPEYEKNDVEIIDMEIIESIKKCIEKNITTTYSCQGGIEVAYKDHFKRPESKVIGLAVPYVALLLFNEKDVETFVKNVIQCQYVSVEVCLNINPETDQHEGYLLSVKGSNYLAEKINPWDYEENHTEEELNRVLLDDEKYRRKFFKELNWIIDNFQ